MRLLKRIAFCLPGILIFILIAATLLEKTNGTEFVNEHIYGSVPFVVLWEITALAALLYLLKRRLYRRLPVFLLHLSFLLILTGAFTTWLYSEQGTLHLREGSKQHFFINREGHRHDLPFSISLDRFEIVFYEGTRTPMDYVSHVSVVAAGKESIHGEISMNKVFSFMGYRFYQSGYDAYGQGTVLHVSHDPYGIGITYAGYAALPAAMLLFFFLDPKSTFRLLARRYLNRHRGANGMKIGCTLFLFLAFSGFAEMRGATADALPHVLPREVAARFGNLYVLYNGRICPLQTFAKDFTVKLHGKAAYRGLTPEQVLTGWLFYYDSWQDEPFIRIKSGKARRLLGIKGKYAAWNDFADSTTGTYKLEEAMRQIRSGEPVAGKQGIEEADEKFHIAGMVCAGAFLKIFPHRDTKGKGLQWYAQSDSLPRDMESGKRKFIRKAMNRIGEWTGAERYESTARLADQIRQYQQAECGTLLPSATKFQAEKLYNRLDYGKSLAVLCLCSGLLVFIYYCRCMATERLPHPGAALASRLLLWFVFVYLSVVIALRGYVASHIPLSNGFETMQFLTWCSAWLTLVWQRRFLPALPFGLLLCGLALSVATWGGSNPQITRLMPVLSSPLLSIHVAVILLAYALLAFTMLNGVTAVILSCAGKRCRQQIRHLQGISQLILYPATFLLAIGIFTGAVWANMSWGRYWGWDPKEVWALVTLLTYAFALHPASLPWFRRPMFFHAYCIGAFLTVLMTYFGVNFLLGGMHSYA